jgi:hypothetical protein
MYPQANKTHTNQYKTRKKCIGRRDTSAHNCYIRMHLCILLHQYIFPSLMQQMIIGHLILHSRPSSVVYRYAKLKINIHTNANELHKIRSHPRPRSLR